MNVYKGKLMIYTGEGAENHPEWCTYEIGEWIRAHEVLTKMDLHKKEIELYEAILKEAGIKFDRTPEGMRWRK